MPWLLAISVALLGYAYAGYPALIWLLAAVRGRPVARGPFAGGVSVLIAAHDEEDALPRKLENLLDLARTEPIREIWIGLDGCTDRTAERVREKIRLSNLQCPITNVQGEGIQDLEFRIGNEPLAKRRTPPRVEVIEFESRRGKAAVLNDLMAAAGQPILVMMDARQRVEAGAVSKLLENFADAAVGVVSGALVYESAAGGAQKGAESYWGYEKFIRRCESRFWAVPGATGAFYAIRKELCAPIPENSLVDDVLIPMRAVLKGFRCLFEPSARVFDVPTVHFGQEGLRKRRTLAGIWQLWRLEPKIYSVFANPIGFQWFSHKFLRLLTPFLVLAAYVALGTQAWDGEDAFRWLFGGASLWLCVSFLAYLGGRRLRSRALGLLGAFFGVNWALWQAAGDAWTGRFEARWKK